jgi:hypothetical protein
MIWVFPILFAFGGLSIRYKIEFVKILEETKTNNYPINRDQQTFEITKASSLGQF